MWETYSAWGGPEGPCCLTTGDQKPSIAGVSDYTLYAVFKATSWYHAEKIYNALREIA